MGCNRQQLKNVPCPACHGTRAYKDLTCTACLGSGVLPLTDRQYRRRLMMNRGSEEPWTTPELQTVMQSGSVDRAMVLLERAGYHRTREEVEAWRKC